MKRAHMRRSYLWTRFALWKSFLARISCLPINCAVTTFAPMVAAKPLRLILDATLTPRRPNARAGGVAIWIGLTEPLKENPSTAINGLAKFINTGDKWKWPKKQNEIKQISDKWMKGSMNLSRKKSSLFLLLGSVIFAVIFTPVCAPLCPNIHHGNEFSQDVNCSFASHSFVRIGGGLAALFMLSFMSLFLVFGISYIPQGFFLPPFRPPRLHS